MENRPEELNDPIAPPGFEPTNAEIEAWAEHERTRRAAWLRGPTDAQKADWAARERARRLAATRGAAPRIPTPDPETLRQAQRYIREAQLAAEGAMSLVFNLSVRDMLDQLVRAGREWEEEFTTQPARRRRVPLNASDSDLEPTADRPSPPGSDSPGVTSQPT